MLDPGRMIDPDLKAAESSASSEVWKSVEARNEARCPASSG
jgi:hypothetical protein